MKRSLSHWLACCLFTLITGATARDVSSEPVKIEVKATGHSYVVGDRIRLSVTLLDKDNVPTPALDPIEVSIVAGSSAQDASRVDQLIFDPGGSEKELVLQTNDLGTGLIYAGARSAGLLDGGVHLVLKRRPVSMMMSGDAQLSTTPPAPPPALVTLRYSPERRFWADGRDSAEVSAFYIGSDRLQNDIELRFHDGSGTMDPNPIMILASTALGTAKLAFDEAKAVTVELLRSTPTVEIVGSNELEIEFVPPPATKLSVSGNQPSVSLGSSTLIQAQLLDDQDRPVLASERRLVAFSLKRGRGSFSETEKAFPDSGLMVSTTFTPSWPGQFVISTSTEGFDPAETAVIEVYWPTLLMLISALGGLVGGIVAMLPKRARKGWWKGRNIRLRALTGLITGFVLYWACALGLVTFVAGGALLNPITASLMSILGGWIGTEVFAVILKGLGIKVPTPRAE